MRLQRIAGQSFLLCGGITLAAGAAMSYAKTEEWSRLFSGETVENTVYYLVASLGMLMTGLIFLIFDISRARPLAIPLREPDADSEAGRR